MLLPSDPDAEGHIVSMAAHGEGQAVFGVLADEGWPYSLSPHDFAVPEYRSQWGIIFDAYTHEGRVTPLSLLDAIDRLYPHVDPLERYGMLARFPNYGREPSFHARDYVGRMRDASERYELAALAQELLAVASNPSASAAEGIQLIRQYREWASATSHKADTLGRDLPDLEGV